MVSCIIGSCYSCRQSDFAFIPTLKMEAHRHQPMVSRHLSSKDCMSATLIDCEKKWKSLMMWLAGWHEICVSAAANPLIQGWCSLETLPKAQRTQGLSSAYQSKFFRSYHKFLRKFWSNIFRISRPSSKIKISTKHQHFEKSWPNLDSESWPRLNFITTTKHQQQNNDQTSASKFCLSVNFRILTRPWNLVLKVLTKN